jgi:hypothetical protein
MMCCRATNENFRQVIINLGIYNRQKWDGIPKLPAGECYAVFPRNGEQKAQTTISM